MIALILFIMAWRYAKKSEDGRADTIEGLCLLFTKSAYRVILVSLICMAVASAVASAGAAAEVPYIEAAGDTLWGYALAAFVFGVLL